jgi:hypothetical protein
MIKKLPDKPESKPVTPIPKLPIKEFVNKLAVLSANRFKNLLEASARELSDISSQTAVKGLENITNNIDAEATAIKQLLYKDIKNSKTILHKPATDLINNYQRSYNLKEKKYVN